MVGSAERLNLTRNQAERVDKREVMAWQQAAWRYYEALPEISFAFGFVAQLISRCRLYPAIIPDPERPPVDLTTWLESMQDAGEMENSRAVADKATTLVRELLDNTPGRESGLLRSLALNLSVPGEVYLAHDESKKEWLVLSPEELVSSTGKKYRIQRSRSGEANARRNRELDDKAFVARIWRSHPRFGDEPISSMLGVLDQCEQLVLLDQVMRIMARRASNAGLIFLPDGISAYAASSDEETLADTIAKSMLASTERESAVETVSPKVVQGPPELGDKIRRIVLSDAIDEKMSEAAEKLVDRILSGIDVPKELVRGLSDVKYANAVSISDSLLSAHLEPLLLLICDTLTSVYLRPLIRKGLPEGQQKIADMITFWYDASPIVTRPDESQAANEGYDKKILSAEAWRRARGFSETDAPSDEELLLRIVLDRAPISADQAAMLIERFAPDWFSTQRDAAQNEAGFPDDLSSLLSGETPGGPSGTPENGSAAAEAQGGEVNPNGRMPPRQVPVPQP